MVVIKVKWKKRLTLELVSEVSNVHFLYVIRTCGNNILGFVFGVGAKDRV